MDLNPKLQAAPPDSDVSWIVDGVLPFGVGVVGTLVPTRFDAYARVLHSAWRAGGLPIRWDAVAAWSGRVVHPLAEFVQVARPIVGVEGEPPFVQQPRDGALPGPVLRALKDDLATHTTTPDQCFVGIWEGVGWIDADNSSALRLRLPERIHLVFKDGMDILDHVGWLLPDGRPIYESPSVIWPADRAWFVSTDVDQDSTYVGGSRALIDALISDPRLEVWPASSTDSITGGSDSINR